jgi:signal transduction histidine kinase
VIGYLELLGAEASEQFDEDSRHYLERISISARYMDVLIRDLLELSRIGRTQTAVEPVALRDLIEDIAAELRRKHAAAEFAVDDMPTVEINPVRARQLFTNLMENAVRHGGRNDIAVSVSCEPAAEGQVVVTVADDGVGVSQEYRERVFGIFERLEGEVTAGTGTGIGLAMCRKIVEQMDGSIWIDPAPVGTTFKIALPALATQQSSKDVEVQRQ